MEYHGLELDIVIPDVRTLEKDSKMTLLILIPKSSDKQIIDQKISQLKSVQPIIENICLPIPCLNPFENPPTYLAPFFHIFVP